MEQIICEESIQQKYAGFTYEELIEVVQQKKMSDLEFIVAQPDLLSEFKEYLADTGRKVYDEETATFFLRGEDNKVMDAQEEEGNFYWGGEL